MAAPRCAVLHLCPRLTVSAFWRFVLVGFVNTAVGYGAILFFLYVIAAGYLASNALGYVVGGLVSYFLNKSFTFESARAHRAALPRFVLVVAGCYLVNLVVLKIGMSLWRLHPALAQALAVAAYTVIFYAASRRLVFGHQAQGR